MSLPLVRPGLLLPRQGHRLWLSTRREGGHENAGIDRDPPGSHEPGIFAHRHHRKLVNGHGQAIGSPWQKLHLGEEEFGNFMLQELTGLPPAFSSRELKDAGSESRADDLSGSMPTGGAKTLLQQLKESQFKAASGLADQFGKIYPDWR